MIRREKRISLQFECLPVLLVQDLQVFVMRLEQINAVIRIPSEVITSLWYSLAEILGEIFVEGYALLDRVIAAIMHFEMNLQIFFFVVFQTRRDALTEGEH